jgi:tetratricopeptide (TPR) repeat protein
VRYEDGKRRTGIIINGGSISCRSSRNCNWADLSVRGTSPWLEHQFDDAAEQAKALNTAERAAELAPDDDRSLALCAGFFAFMTDDLERAVVLAERAIDLNPNLAFAWTVLGWASTWLGDVGRARAAFDAAVRLNPLDRQALMQILPGYIVICFVSGLHDERLAWAERLLAPVNLTGLLSALDVEIILFVVR